MKEKYEVDNNLIQEKTEYEKEKLNKKLKLVRNEFVTVGKYEMPLIKKQEIDLDKIDLWNYTKTKLKDDDNRHKTIHFFTYFWLFENVYEKPELAMEKLSQHYAILSPEFSLYWDMPRALQIYSTFKNRWCGAFFQKHGMKVIPTVCCAGNESYDFCFDGIEQGSVVAVSTYCREKYKQAFMKSYNKMLEVIKPVGIICYGTPFPEMKGTIKTIAPFDKEKLIKKIGVAEFTKKYLAGELYPEI